MEYTVHGLATLAGVSDRTIRFYDGKGLLKPCRMSRAGYRLYGPKEVDRLQDILFYRALGMELGAIARLLESPGYSRERALREHLAALYERRLKLDGLILTVERSIANEKGEISMSDEEKFEGLKRARIERNEREYGAEARRLYGDATIDASNAKYLAMDEATFTGAEALGREVMEALRGCLEAGDARGPEAKRLFELHRRWLLCYWPTYTSEMHIGLASTYVEDARFAAYYDAVGAGGALMLRNVIEAFAGEGPQG